MDNVLDNVVDDKLTGTEPGAVDASGRTFSQEEVNSIIRERLTKEKDKTEKQFQEMSKEFKQKELNFRAKEILSGKGLSLELMNILKYDDEETFNANLLILESAMTPKQEGNHEDQAEQPGLQIVHPGLKLNSGGNHGNIQHTADASIKTAMGLK
ncbi:MAG: capsid assembly scaffolding protein Gp46 family protein [Acetobacterium sp.]